MRRFILAVSALGLVSLVAAGPAAGLGGEAAELVNARANARAGGPVSARDVELLERYGCLSGTTASAFCQAQSHRRYKRRRRRRR